MIGIYSRDNLAGQLGGALDAALARRQAAVDRSAGYRNNDVKAVTNMLKSIGYDQEDPDEKRLRELEAEKAEVKAAEQAEIEESMRRSAEALKYRRAMMSAAQPMAMPVQDGFIPQSKSNELLTGNSGVPDYFSVMRNPVNWNYNPEEEARRSTRHYGYGDYMGVY